MELTLILEHLAKADQHLALSEEHLTEQRLRIAGLERYGHDTALARKLLLTFEQTRDLCLEERLRVLAELDNLDREPS